MDQVQMPDTPEKWGERVGRLRKKDGRFDHTDFDTFVFTEYANSVTEIHSWVQGLGEGWIFRGQRDAGWRLDSSIDRITRRDTNHLETDGRLVPTVTAFDPAAKEWWMLQAFQCSAHRYIGSPPADGEILDWLTLMQHYGTPTRMLDWSESPYVALYFAVEEHSTDSNKAHAIWALSLDRLLDQSNAIMAKSDPFFGIEAAAPDHRARTRKIDAMLLSSMKGMTPDLPRIVTTAVNLRSNERQEAQQGLSLFALNWFEGFGVNLVRTMMGPSVPQPPPVRRLIVAPGCRTDSLRALTQMNVTGATLFPGLDGFSRSLRIQLELNIGDWMQSLNPSPEVEGDC